MKNGLQNISGNENPWETLHFTSPEVWDSAVKVCFASSYELVGSLYITMEEVSN